MRIRLAALLFGLSLAFVAAASAGAESTLLRAGATLQAIEIDHGERFFFERLDGRRIEFELVDTGVNVLLTNLREPKRPQSDGGTLYLMRCELRVNGAPLTLERYVGAQESFYEPLVIDGVRLWFDGARAAEQVLEFNHGPCLPTKAARFAVQDATQRICPDEVLPWFATDRLALDIAESYAGADCWMGGYKGAEAHGGVDINMPKGTPLRAPFALDDHYVFHKLYEGANNNRWRGWRTWPNGERWTVQVHHLLTLRVPEHTPISAGEAFALGSGVNPGTHEHVHFNFKITPAGRETPIDLDPWMLFWQTFEDERWRRGEIRARMDALGPVKTGERVVLRSTGSRAGLRRPGLECRWAISDGTSLRGAEVEHVFAAPGVYAVTLTVDDGGARMSTTQHVTVHGARVCEPVLQLRASDLPTFIPRRAGITDVYGRDPGWTPYELALTARPTSPRPEPRTIELVNAGGGALPEPRVTIAARTGDVRWLAASVHRGGDGWRVQLQADATGLAAGFYRANVALECAGALNGRQSFVVTLDVPHHPPMHPSLDLARAGERGNMEEVRIDDASLAGAFFATPGFWVGHRFAFWPGPRGYRGFSLISGGRPSETDFVRFTPDLDEGRFEVSLHADTPFSPDARFAVRVHHRRGDEVIWMEPHRSRVIGVFEFAEGRDGFVELHTRGSRGGVTADCVVFRYVDGRPPRPPLPDTWKRKPR